MNENIMKALDSELARLVADGNYWKEEAERLKKYNAVLQERVGQLEEELETFRVSSK